MSNLYKNLITTGDLNRGECRKPTQKDFKTLTSLFSRAKNRADTYYYIMPNAEHARIFMSDIVDGDIPKIFSCVPKELVQNINIQQMKVTLVNGSDINFVGVDEYNCLKLQEYKD